MSQVKGLYVRIFEEGKSDHACELEIPVGTSLSRLVEALEDTVLGDLINMPHTLCHAPHAIWCQW